MPELPLRTQYQNDVPAKAEPAGPATALDKKLTAPLPEEHVAFSDWWRYFGNPELDALMNRGLANNPDMRIATLRLAQAKVRSTQASAGHLPTLSLPMVISRQAPGGTVGAVPVGTSARAPQTAVQGSLRGDWRPDVWGEQSAVMESAQMEVWRAAFERENVQRNLTATVALKYVEYLALNDRLRVARQTQRVMADTLRTMERRLELGDATLAEIQQQRAAVFSLRATIPTLELQREEAVNTLAFVVGAVPGSLNLSEQGLNSLSVPSVVPGLPSALLLRRPDIRMAEARLLAADADIDVARARILPPLDLSAQAGYSANNIAQLFQPQTMFWTTIASITASIFDGGRKEGDKKIAESVREEMVETYARSVYLAVREVESALIGVRQSERRMTAQREASVAAKKAWDINSRVYAMGGIDHTTLLDSERTYHRYLDDYERSQTDYFSGYISLFQALGGGVKLADRLPGRGARPEVAASGPAADGGASYEAPTPQAVNGLDWQSSLFGSQRSENFWQIELPGLYHHSTVGAAWRDLRERYPEQMAGRIVRPRLSGKVDDEGDSQQAWYRLYIAKFARERDARALCERMMANQDRCRVVAARPDERPVEPPEAANLADEVARPMAEREARRPEETPLSPAVVQAIASLPISEVIAETAPAVPTATAKPVAEKATKAATARVVSTSRRPASGKDQRYAVQVGVFAELDNALRDNAQWQARGYDSYVAERPGRSAGFVVRTGIYDSSAAAARAVDDIRRKDGVAALVSPVIADGSARPGQVDLPQPLRRPQPAVQPPAAEPVPEAAAAPLAAEPATPVANMISPAGVPAAESSAAGEPVITEEIAREQTATDPLVDAPSSPPASRHTVQLGAFATIEHAATAYGQWRSRGYPAYVAETDDARGRLRFAVRVGSYADAAEASAMARQLQRRHGVRAVATRAAVDERGDLRKINVEPLLAILPGGASTSMNR